MVSSLQCRRPYRDRGLQASLISGFSFPVQGLGGYSFANKVYVRADNISSELHHHMKMRPSGALLQVLFCFLISQCSALVYISFSIYPPESQECLNNAADASGCALEGVTTQYINSCLCTNGGHFIDNTAICLHNGDPSDVRDVWNTMVAACDESATPIVYSESEFLSLGLSSAVQSSSPTSVSHSKPSTSILQAAPVQTTSTSAVTPESSPSASGTASSNNNGNSGNNVGNLSGGMIALIGTIAGVGSLIIAFIACCCPFGGRNKIEKVVKQTLRQHMKTSEPAEHKSLWTGTEYD